MVGRSCLNKLQCRRSGRASLLLGILFARVLGQVGGFRAGYPKPKITFVSPSPASPLQQHRRVQSLMQAPSFFISKALSVAPEWASLLTASRVDADS